MIQIKPKISVVNFLCPYCNKKLSDNTIVWQGIHICITSKCTSCKTEIVSALPIGHTKYFPIQVNQKTNEMFGHPRGFEWLGKPLLHSLKHPSEKKIRIKVYKQCYSVSKKVVIVNCLDYLYGHCLLKLFNVQKLKRLKETTKIIVLIPECIRWLVPVYVHEIWTVESTLPELKNYYLNLEKFINRELREYNEVNVCETNCHPAYIQISDFSKTLPNTQNSNKLITYYWRDDRLWLSDTFINSPSSNRFIRKLFFIREKYKIIRVFSRIKKVLPDYSFAVIGHGREELFPQWIHDYRVPRIDERRDKSLCEIYSRSALMIGTLGSHMILPVAHAFMSIELHHTLRTECFGQDMIIPSHEEHVDPRLYNFRHRILPSTITEKELANITSSMIIHHEYSKQYFNSQSSEKS
jgi:hypothetical protein